jgi:hypothetical protein
MLAPLAGIAGMIAQERMADMTIDALQSEGYSSSLLHDAFAQPNPF